MPPSSTRWCCDEAVGRHTGNADKVLALRSLEALAKVANGKATKIIIPSDLQNLGGVVPSIKELMTDPKDAE